jgi:hypothetical protein
MSYDYSLFRAPGPGPMDSWDAAPPSPLGTVDEVKARLSSRYPALAWRQFESSWFSESTPEFQLTPEEDGSCRFVTVRRVTRPEIEMLCRMLEVVAVDQQKGELIRG